VAPSCRGSGRRAAVVFLGMGNITHSHPSKSEIAAEWVRYEALYNITGLTHADFVPIYAFFRHLETSRTAKTAKRRPEGSISIGELSDKLRCKTNVLISSSFTLFDESYSGYCNFVEFTLCLWNFCTHTPSSLLFYSYQKIVPDGLNDDEEEEEENSNEMKITVDDAVSMLKVLYWENDVAAPEWPSVLQYIMSSIPESVAPEEFDQLFPFTSPILEPIQRVRGVIFSHIVSEASFDALKSKPYMFHGTQVSLAELKREVNIHDI
jgi:hypothetical protein